MEAATEPTLPRLVRPLWRRWGPARRGTVIAAVGLLLIGAVVFAVAKRGKTYRYSGSAAPAFSFRFSGLHRVPPRPGELVRLEQSSGGTLLRSLAVEPVRLPARPNPVSTTLPFAAPRFGSEAAKAHAGYDQVVEGRNRLDILDGREAYMLGFTATGVGPKPDGHLWVGKTYLVPASGKAPSRAVAVELMERVTSPGVAAAVRNYPAGFLSSWPIRYWVQHDTSVDVPGAFERVLKSFSASS